ncbi:MAG: C-GCAxxG-C-C family protein [Armatimonadota bacterium]|nr:C-GCAxxG-C-C family protein [Armatimonadota bacterium]
MPLLRRAERLNPMDSEIEKRIKEAGERAEGFRQQGFHCSEAVLRGVAAALEIPLDQSLLRASTGLRGGGGGYGDRCGALEAGAMLIGFLFGRVVPEEDNSCASRLVWYLHDRFQRELGSTLCRFLKPMAHLHWSQDFSCGPVYRKGAELAAEIILSAHALFETCPPVEVARSGEGRTKIDAAALAEMKNRIATIAREGRLDLTEVARASQARLGVEDEDIRVCLSTPRFVHPAWGNRYVVEGRKRDRWYLTVVLRIRPEGTLEVLDLF